MYMLYNNSLPQHDDVGIALDDLLDLGRRLAGAAADLVEAERAGEVLVDGIAAALVAARAARHRQENRVLRGVDKKNRVFFFVDCLFACFL